MKIPNHIYTILRILTGVAVMGLLPVTSGYGQDAVAGQTLELYFHPGSSRLDMSLCDNGVIFSRLKTALTGENAPYIARITVRGWASPDGMAARNEQLAWARAREAERQIIALNTAVPAFRIRAEGKGRNWPELRRLVDEDPDNTYREKILRIIDCVQTQSNVKTDASHKRLQMLFGTGSWNYMMQHYFPLLRKGEIAVRLTPDAPAYVVSAIAHILTGRPALEFKLSDPRGGEVEVPIGIYSVLIFNNTVTDFSQRVGFRGMARYETFEYYCKPQDGSGCYYQPDILAVFRLADFEVTGDMVTLTGAKNRSMSESRLTSAKVSVRALSGARPCRLTCNAHLLVHVSGLNNASAATGSLKGFASSVFLATGQTSATPVNHTFPLNNPQYYEGQYKNGTIDAGLTILGRLPVTSRYWVDITFRLRREYNGSTTFPTPPDPPCREDITSRLETEIDGIRINIEMGTQAGPVITLPDVGAPDEGGFDVDISGWGEEVSIPIR